MTKAERLGVLRDGLAAAPPEQRRAVMRGVRKHFRGKSMDDLQEAFNVVLRESWRAQHGNTTEWDRQARATGIRLDG